MTAAAEAMEASTAAKVASDAAQTAKENVATLQTGETSGGLAHAAYMQAKAAADAAAEAQTASDNAAEATDGVAATRLLVMAETARDNAVAAQGMAETQGAAAMAAAMAELMIVGTVKTVGGTSLDATAGSSVVTTDGDTVTTGLIKDLNPDHTVLMTDGDGGEAKSAAGADPQVAYVAPTAGVAERVFDIGKVVDSADDMARLMIVTQYAGSKTVNVYASTGMTDETLSGRLLSDGRIQTDGVDDEIDTNDRFVTLKPAGMYYLGLDETSLLGNGSESVAANAKPVQVFSFSGNGEDGIADTADDVSGHGVFVGDATTEAGVTTVNYAAADITFAINRDGDVDTGESGNEEVAVTAKIPEATDYKHIHFGVWAALGDPEKDGTQELSDLGIGFIQSIGDGLTGADMPNNGGAEYSGNWAGAVQAADEDGNGDISLTSGEASLTADFDKATIKVDLDGLAKLDGTIDTNTFAGTKATVGTNSHRLTAAGMFKGSFSGGFYGAKAAEAGGVFDFTSEDAEDGAFRGAFGGDRD